MQKMCRERVGKGRRGEGGGEGLCSIAAVYIYVDFMSVCLSCLGITEIVRHFFVCLSMRVFVCASVCVSAFIFSHFVFQQAFASCYFCVFSRFSPFPLSHLVYCVCFVAAARYAANNFI